MSALAGKGALVTGAAAGIGAAIAESFAAAGADLVLADLDGDALEQVAVGLRRHSTRVHTIVADCGDVPAVRRMVDEAATSLGRLDVLINNAGITFQVDMLELDEAGWERVNRVNIKGLFFALQRAAIRMIEAGRGGRIINIASISGRGYPRAANIAYVASKGAVIALTQIAAHRLGCNDINVNAICPGLTLTSLMNEVIVARAAGEGRSPADVLGEMERSIPIRRANRPEDIAAMALFLAGEGGRNITGQAYNVDGGLVTS